MYGEVYQRRCPKPHRLTYPPQFTNLSISGGGSGGGGDNHVVEESYNLVGGNSPEFAMIIRLPPNLQEAIKRLTEEEGGEVAKIKFDSNPNNPTENVIDIGGNEFRFTWSHERGDLCDIYEERHNGENREGLLVKSGCAWRKLNVQRVLDASMKNYVKMRSMEVERKPKPIKTIILNNGSPSVNNHKKALVTTSVEGRMVRQLSKDPSFRRQKVGLAQERGVIHADIPAQQDKGWNASPLDLQNKLIALLAENPTGLNFRALKEAVGESTMKIKLVLEKIAAYHAPGRYILKGGVGLESFKKLSSDIGSFSDYVPEQASNLEKVSLDISEQQFQLSRQLAESNLVEKVNTQDDSGVLFGDKKASEHGEECASSSSESGSGSDSGTDSESESESGSDSGSGSSSDSDSVGSLSNKEGSDVEVNIMSSDDENAGTGHIVQNPKPFSDVDMNIISNDEKKEIDHIEQNPEPGICTSPLPLKTEERNELNGVGKINQAGQVSNTVGISNELLNDYNETAYVRSSQETTPISHYRNNNPERLSGSMLGSDTEYLDEDSESAKNLGGCSVQPLISGGNKDQTLQAMDRVGDTTADKVSERGVSSMAGNSHLDALQSSQRQAETRKTVNAPDIMERPEKSFQNSGYISKTIGGLSCLDESYGSVFRSTCVKFSTTNDNVNRETLDVNSHAYEKSSTENVKNGAIGDRMSVPPKSPYRKQREQVRNLIDAGQRTHSQLEASPKDTNMIDVKRPSMVDGGGSLLKRKLSNLESGKLREPTYGVDCQGSKQKIVKYSFIPSESTPSASDHLHSDSNKESLTEKVIQESKQFKPDYGVGNQEGSRWKEIVVEEFEITTRPHQGITITEGNQFTRADHADVENGNQLNRQADRGTNFRKNLTSKSQGMGPKGHKGTSRKASVNATQQIGTWNKVRKLSPNIIKQKNSQKSNIDALVTNKDNFWMDRNNTSQKRGKIFSDEGNSAYLKYKKNEPEFRGSIKDFSQYKLYVEEYREKYDCYFSLHKQLKAYRNDFIELGQDLKVAKARGREEYYNISNQLLENYRQCGTTYKRMKKIFLILHEELKCLKNRIKDFAVLKTEGRISLKSTDDAEMKVREMKNKVI